MLFAEAPLWNRFRERRREHGLRRICKPEFKHEVPKKPRCLALNAPPRGALAACHALGGLQSSLGSGRDQPPQHYRALECRADTANLSQRWGTRCARAVVVAPQ